MLFRQKLIAALIAVPALVGGVLVAVAAAPAEAAGKAAVPIRVGLSGTVTGPELADTARFRNVKVELHDWNGRISREVKTVPVNQATGAYSFGSFALGKNNSPTVTRRLSISAQVRDFTSDVWQFHQWFWRGSTSGGGAAAGGTKYIEDASGVRLTKYNKGGFKANFSFGKVVGQVNNASGADGGADIRISAPPRTMPKGSDLRSLDIPYCANDFAATTTNSSGHYEQTFLPAAGLSDKRYLIKVSSREVPAAMKLWNNAYGSCFNARAYANSNANLIALPVDTLTMATSNIESSKASIKGDLDFSRMTAQPSDYRLTLREYLPYKKVLDSPIVASVTAARNGNYEFDNVRPGRYWLESGRRTGCSAWYPSLFTNNNLYFQGADRGAERWKTVAGKYAEKTLSKRMGYVAKTPSSGYKGWMYRGTCVQRGAGAIITTSISGAQALGSATHPLVDATIRAGATVSGHISRIGGKTNKEMLVSIYSTKGTLVMRTAYSSKSGNFVVRGLASGNYNIELNADSWRGIGRTFTGRHTIRVTAGHSYRVGTLRARF